MKPQEFEDYLISLSEDDYEALVAERTARLNPEQQKVVLVRQARQKEIFKTLRMLEELPPEKQYEELYLSLLDSVEHECEHGRSFCKSCGECEYIDYIMFPEMFDKDGNRIED